MTFSEPGQWYQEFELTNGSGWISKDTDEYGNVRNYIDDATKGFAGLPDTIYLNGIDTGDSEAWIELFWQGTSSEPLLVRAEVYRPTTSGEAMTQYVEYYHLGNNGTDPVVQYYDDGSTGSSAGYKNLQDPSTSLDLIASDDLGTVGDLVQVIKYTAVDPGSASTDWRSLVTQYRYHDTSLSAPSTGDIRLQIEGLDHQLKMVFKPQQLEFIAQSRLSGSSTTPDDKTVVIEANKFLKIDDDGTVDTGVDMYESAEKIVSYTKSTESPVDIQFLQATSCGCGGGSTTAVMRTYDTIDGWSTTFGAGIGATTVNGKSLQIAEFEVTDFNTDPSGTASNAYRTLAYDMLLLGDNGDKPYVWMKTVVEGDAAITERGGNPGTDTPRAWVTKKMYDLAERAVVGMRYPSSFVDANGDSTYTLAGTGGVAPSATLISDGGLGMKYGYDLPSKNENVGITSIVSWASGTAVVSKLQETVYRADTSEREYLPESVSLAREETASTDVNDFEVVSYEYDFDITGSANSAKLDSRKTTVERAIVAENGDSTSLSAISYEFFDNSGNLIWVIDPDNTLTRYEYDYDTGALVKIVRNSEHPDDLTLPSDMTDPLYATKNELTPPTSYPDPFATITVTGTPLTTEYKVDLIGRTTQVIRPGGVSSYTVREMREDADRNGILYYATVNLPFELSTGVYNGPASVRLMDMAGQTTRSSTFELDTAATYTPASRIYTLDTELSRSATAHDIAGAVNSRKQWWAIGKTEETIHTTQYTYDSFGRTTDVTDAEGTITHNTHDAYDRVVASSVGTSSGNLQTVAEYFYDGDPAVAPAQGVGNGNLTAIKLYDGETSAARITRNYYDVRDRQIATVAPDAPLNLTRYDNLNRSIESAVYPEPTSAPLLDKVQDIISDTAVYPLLPVTHTDLNHPTGGERSWHTLTDYSQRGYVWRQQTAIDPGDDTSPEYLSSYSWFDVDGNQLASWEPNSPMTVYAYDEHDRVSTLYVSDRLDEVTNGLDYTSATSISGDTILEQAEYTYNYATGGGVLELVKTKMRAHDATTTGALADADSITSYIGTIYDSALRKVATVNFGTNKSGFSTGTSTAPTLSNFNTLAALRLATDVLFSWQTYNTRGLVDEVTSIQSGTTSADEIKTRFLYDDLYRAFATIENYDNATLAWDAVKGRYAVTGLDYTDHSEDQVTSFVHDKVNKVIKRVAHIPADPSGEVVQVTEYVYGTTVGSSSNVMDSLVASNNLLSRVKYPDESTGEVGASAKYYVDYAYNRLSELRGVTDQNRTIHSYQNDKQGRVLADIVDTLAINTGTNARNVDNAIRRIGYAYDTLGRMTATTSHTTTAASGNERDEVEISYTPLWQVASVAQQHDGLVDSSSPTVKYVYDNKAATGAADNYSRLDELQYPKDVELGTGTVKYEYFSGIDSRLSRVKNIRVLGFNHGVNGSSVPVFVDTAVYDRIGLGMVAKTALNPLSTWDVVLDRTVNHDGTSTSGAYPSFDRFGRIVSHMWVRDDFGPQSPVQSYANQPAYMDISHTYDRSSNRLSYDDHREGAKLPDRDRAFTYDRMNRLTEELRTPIPVGSVYTAQHASQQWNLDMLGNWDDKTVDADHDGSFTDNGGVNYFDDREHNQANEIESGLQYDQRLYTSGIPTFYDHAYDDNGNMTDERSGKSLPIAPALMAGQLHTYDAWNRLVKTEYITSAGASTTISENTYNGLGWRTSKKFDTSEGAYDGMDQKRLYYYGTDWRILEERIDTDVNTNTIGAGGLDDDADWISQQFWGLRYIDDAISKRVDRDTGGADGDWVDSDTTYWHQLTDTQFSVGVVLDQDGIVYERNDYDAYGTARHRYGGDADGDGIGTGTDYTLPGLSANIGNTGYHADLDVNCDGVIDGTDITEVNNNTPLTGTTALPAGWIGDPNSGSGPDNAIGYAGYVFNHEREDYVSRNRNYNAKIGRWMQRDFAEYVDGSNVLEYVKSNPNNANDPSGLCSVPFNCTLKTEKSINIFQKACIYECREVGYQNKRENGRKDNCLGIPCDDDKMPNSSMIGTQRSITIKGASCKKSYPTRIQIRTRGKIDFETCLSDCKAVGDAVKKGCKLFPPGARRACKKAAKLAEYGCTAFCGAAGNGGFQ